MTHSEFLQMQVSFIQKSIVAVGTVVLLGAIVPESAKAATVTHTTLPISFNESDLSLGNTTLLLPYFDSSLGTLDAVKYSISGKPYAKVTLNNISTPANPETIVGSVIGYITTNVYFRHAGFPTYVGNIYASATIDTIELDQGASESAENELLYEGTSGSVDYFNIGDFINTGKFGVDIASTFFLSSDNSGPSSSRTGVAGVNNLFATVTYEYTPTAVPTPALLPGLVALGFGAIRKRKASATA